MRLLHAILAALLLAVAADAAPPTEAEKERERVRVAIEIARARAKEVKPAPAATPGVVAKPPFTQDGIVTTAPLVAAPSTEYRAGFRRGSTPTPAVTTVRYGRIEAGCVTG